jgi:transposase-like protein
MDLHWQVARRRAWIELGERENLTFVELSRRSGMAPRTLRRWSAAFRAQRERDPLGQQQKERLHERVELSIHEAQAEAELAALGQSFVEPIEEGSQVDQIQIELSGNRRLVIVGAVDVEQLARVIATVERC